MSGSLKFSREALYQFLGGAHNLNYEVIEQKVLDALQLDNKEEDLILDLPIRDSRYFEDFGINAFILDLTFNLTDLNAVENLFLRSEEENKIQVVIRPFNINVQEKTCNMIYVENVSYEETISKWYTVATELPALLVKQHELNVGNCGEQYLATRVTNKGKAISWEACVTMELAELLDSTPWKHWKSGEFNYANIFTESVDIAHFIFSIWIEETFFRMALLGLPIEEVLKEAGKEDRSDFYHVSGLIGALVDLESNKDDIEVMDNVILEMIKSLKINFTVSKEYYKSLLFLLVMICKYHPKINKTPEDFVRKYYAKNLLNKFRTDHGYNDPSIGYVKIWNGEEDNVVLDRLMEDITTTDMVVFQNELYEALEQVYATIGK